ncbi:BTB/POZ domain-containing protein 6-B-like [Mya arenaria]|uniref:BTB/POZ domain-containing protein 6-B-like n=1 Tax=Mya arenaria TaxID=6604 RepID=UPI0022E98639|nr:BTB/POZ domain-containing protein 6-B-like [Mya arenaria]
MASINETSVVTGVITEAIDASANEEKTLTERPWQEDKGVPESLLYTYENSLWTDVTLECTTENGDTHFIKAHKHVLASRSTVFEAMLFGPAADKGDIVKITTFRYELMDLLIRYLYSEKTHFTESTSRLMFEMAYFYQVPALVNLCSQYLQSIAREDNVCEILDLALQYDNVGLRQAACDYIDQNATIIIETDSFVHVSKLCLEYILKADTFHVDEKTILRRAIEWAKLHQGNDSLNMDEDIRFNITVKHFRNTIGNAFQYIRLGAMSFAEFSECAGSTLDAEEIKDILLFTNICSTDEFHQKRLPKKKIFELKNEHGRLIIDWATS